MTHPDDEHAKAEAEYARLRAINDRRTKDAHDALDNLERAINADEERAKKGK